jgi:hypothetical protein
MALGVGQMGVPFPSSSSSASSTVIPGLFGAEGADEVPAVASGLAVGMGDAGGGGLGGP